MLSCYIIAGLAVPKRCPVCRANKPPYRYPPMQQDQAPQEYTPPAAPLQPASVTAELPPPSAMRKTAPPPEVIKAHQQVPQYEIAAAPKPLPQQAPRAVPMPYTNDARKLGLPAHYTMPASTPGATKPSSYPLIPPRPAAARPAASYTTTPAETWAQIVCPYYSLGTCRYGDGCLNIHVSPTAPITPGERPVDVRDEGGRPTSKVEKQAIQATKPQTPTATTQAPIVAHPFEKPAEAAAGVTTTTAALSRGSTAALRIPYSTPGAELRSDVDYKGTLLEILNTSSIHWVCCPYFHYIISQWRSLYITFTLFLTYV